MDRVRGFGGGGASTRGARSAHAASCSVNSRARPPSDVPLPFSMPGAGESSEFGLLGHQPRCCHPLIRIRARPDRRTSLVTLIGRSSILSFNSARGTYRSVAILGSRFDTVTHCRLKVLADNFAVDAQRLMDLHLGPAGVPVSEHLDETVQVKNLLATSGPFHEPSVGPRVRSEPSSCEVPPGWWTPR